jgi:hypothetical protein
MEKCSEKSKWQAIATSAKKIFRSHGSEASKADMAPLLCSQQESQSLYPKDIAFKSEPSIALSGLDTGFLILSEDPVTSHISTNQTQLPPQPDAVIEAERETDPSSSPAGDGKRTLMRYVAAVGELRAALKLRRPGWESFEFPEFDAIPESEETLALLQEAIEGKLNSCQELGDRSIWRKGKMLAERLFVALSPFAKNFLTIAKEASESVRPSSLF